MVADILRRSMLHVYTTKCNCLSNSLIEGESGRRAQPRSWINDILKWCREHRPNTAWYEKARMAWLTDGEKKFDNSCFDGIPACDGQTDGRTDGWTGGRTSCDSIVRVTKLMYTTHAPPCNASHGKNARISMT